MEDSTDSDCELVIDETILVTVSDDEQKTENLGDDNWHIFHPVSISSSDMKEELFNDETYTCSICNETFRYNIGLICHVEMEHVKLNVKSKLTKKSKAGKSKYVAKASTKVVPKNALAKAVAHVTRKNSCEVCKKSFADNTKLLKHTETCSSKFSCVYCKSKFSWESKYKKHLYKTHKFNAVVVCKHCSCVFGDMNSLATHSLSCESRPMSPTSSGMAEENSYRR